MPKLIDLTGKRYERLLVIKYEEKANNGDSYWLCKCDCEKVLKVLGKSLRYGRSKSCGCLTRDRTISRNTKHNMCSTSVYTVWRSIKQRCYDNNCKAYKNYGGRGINVCDEWLNDFMSFYNWSMSNGYAPSLEIDRRNNDGDYEPSNCRWASRIEQANNNRHNHVITYMGKSQTIQQWSRERNINHGTLLSRIYRGWSPEDALTRKIGNNYKMR
jgi:hypothetical protein